VADIVADLRRHPLPETAVERAPSAPPGLPLGRAAVVGVRPTHIARGPAAVRALLDEACEEFWIVRLSYVNSKGQSDEVTVEPTDIDEDRLYAECLPRGNERVFLVDLVEWARVLTEAEEDLLT
jgi:hypothetical protein